MAEAARGLLHHSHPKCIALEGGGGVVIRALNHFWLCGAVAYPAL